MKYLVYLLINNTRREVFFDYCVSLESLVQNLPGEIGHWQIGAEDIINPVIIEENLELVHAEAVVLDLQEKSIRNPQGRTILKNRKIREIR